MSTGGNGWPGTPPSDAPLRPARQTPNLRLPVPGDTNAADVVTDLGRLADAIDALQASGFLGWHVGDIKATGAMNAPSGWLLCAGQAVDRVVFRMLFDAIGTSYGQGDGTTTFNVPDLRERMPMGASDAVRLGERGGAAQVALTANEMPNHGHGVTDPGHAHGHWDGGHAHAGTTWANSPLPGVNEIMVAITPPVTTANHGPNNPAYGAVPRTAPGTYVGGSKGWHDHYFQTDTRLASIVIYGATTNVSVAAAGGNGAHNNLPPYQMVNFIIKT
jgi:microcystin-dependent protein